MSRSWCSTWYMRLCSPGATTPYFLTRTPRNPTPLKQTLTISEHGFRYDVSFFRMRLKAVSHYEIPSRSHGFPGRRSGAHCTRVCWREHQGGSLVDQRILGLPRNLFLPLHQRLSPVRKTTARRIAPDSPPVSIQFRLLPYWSDPLLPNSMAYSRAETHKEQHTSKDR